MHLWRSVKKLIPCATQNVNVPERFLGNFHSLFSIGTHLVGTAKPTIVIKIGQMFLSDKNYSTVAVERMCLCVANNFKIADIAP